MIRRTRAYVVIFLLALVIAGDSFSIVLIDEVEADNLTIIDYDYEGILQDETQYFVLWNHGTKTFELQVNISALEFEGATGWPDFELMMYEFDDHDYGNNYLKRSQTDANYSCRINFEIEGEERFVVAVHNQDTVDDAIYNISLVSFEAVDFQYTSMFKMDDIDSPREDTIGFTYFETANPYLYRLEGFSETRVIVEWTNLGSEEYYFFIYNKGETCDIFVGLLGFSYYYTYPSLTALVNDFEDLDAGKDDEELILFNIINSTCGGTFTCEANHRYRFWIDVGLDDLTTYIYFDTLGAAEIDYDADLLAGNPDDVVSIRPSFTDPWLEYRQLARDAQYALLGVGAIAVGIVGGLGFTIWYCRKRYY